jgi:hypothetical protein
MSFDLDLNRLLLCISMCCEPVARRVRSERFEMDVLLAKTARFGSLFEDIHESLKAAAVHAW